MRYQVLPGFEDRKHRRREARNFSEDAPSLRTLLDVALCPDADSDQKERLPTTVARHQADVRQDILKARQLVLARQDTIELGPNRAPVALEPRHPRKSRRVEHRVVGDFRTRAIEPFDEGKNANEKRSR